MCHNITCNPLAAIGYCPSKERTEISFVITMIVAVGLLLTACSLGWAGGLKTTEFKVFFSGAAAAALLAIAFDILKNSRTLEKSDFDEFFVVTPRSSNVPYYGPMTALTANTGLLPSKVNQGQQVVHEIHSFFDPDRPGILKKPSARVHAIASRLIAANAPIICCQEVFDKKSRRILSQKLHDAGFTVITSKSASFPKVNSGLLFATRFPIQKEGIAFWTFTNLTESDWFACKGLLRVPLEVTLAEGSAPVKIVIYSTHLQAEVGNEKVRTAQMEAVLSIIERDAKQNPKTPILLIGDLNITDIEFDGTDHNEYSRKNHIFSRFHDFIHMKYTAKELKHDGPQGTFYVDAGSNRTQAGCIYDRILLYKGAAHASAPQFDIHISTLMRNGLSDHLPVICRLDLC